MDKLKFASLVKALYFPKKPEIRMIPPLQYAMIDGYGDPNTSDEFQEAIGAL